MKTVIKAILVSLFVVLLSSCSNQINTIPKDNKNIVVEKKVVDNTKPTNIVTEDYSKYVGVYKFQDENNTKDWTEDQYIVLEKADENLEGRYYGTSDDFDNVREGYYVGFFVSNMKNLQIKDGMIAFSVQLRESDLFSKQIDIKYKASEEVPLEVNPRWVNSQIVNGSTKNPQNYKGKIINGEIHLDTEFGSRIFKKMNF